MWRSICVSQFSFSSSIVLILLTFRSASSKSSFSSAWSVSSLRNVEIVLGSLVPTAITVCIWARTGFLEKLVTRIEKGEVVDHPLSQDLEWVCSLSYYIYAFLSLSGLFCTLSPSLVIPFHPVSLLNPPLQWQPLLQPYHQAETFTCPIRTISGIIPTTDIDCFVAVWSFGVGNC